MSSNLNLADHLLVDSRLLFSSNKSVEIRRGASNISVQKTTPSSISNSMIQFNPQLNNADQNVIDPYHYVELSCTATINAVGLVGPQTVKNYLNNNFSLRQYPIASVTDTCRVDFNQQSEISQPRLFIHQLSNFQNFLNAEDEQVIQSLVPIYPDQSPQYSDLVGSNASPLLNYASGEQHYSSPRGVFNGLFVDVVNTNLQWQFTFTVREPVINPLLEYSALKKNEGMPYCNRFQITLNMIGNLSRMFSLDAVTCPAITGITVNINSGILTQTWLTSPLTQAMPPVVVKGYNRIVVNPTVIQQIVAPGQQIQVTSQALQVGQLPEKLWIYISNMQNYDTPTGHSNTDWNFSIQGVQVLFNNIAGILSDMQSADLWTACAAQEGSKLSFVQNQLWMGSVLCVDPVKLFRLSSDMSAGMIGNFQLTVTINCTNISNAAVTNPSIFLTTALPTLLVTTDKFVTTLVQGYITREDVLRANSLPAHPITNSDDGIYGGSFTDLLKRAHDYVKNNKLISRALPHFSNIPGAAPFIPAAQALASSLGYGGRKATRSQMIRASLGY